jgi:hypothetical protein
MSASSSIPFLPTSMQAMLFAPTSRYFGLPTARLQSADGRTLLYLTRRFLPEPNQLVLRVHRVVQGERLDNLAAQNLGDAEAYWRICDANNAMRPDELTETVGRELLITLPQGIAQS